MLFQVPRTDIKFRKNLENEPVHPTPEYLFTKLNKQS